MTKDGKKGNKQSPREIILVERTDEYQNDITITRRYVSVSVLTVENSERAMEMVRELMDKYGEKEK